MLLKQCVAKHCQGLHNALPKGIIQWPKKRKRKKLKLI